MSWVATHSDLHLSGLTPAACRPDARALGGIDLSTGIFQLDGHGFDGGEAVRFTIGDPSPLRALPSGLGVGWRIVADTVGDPDFFKFAPLFIPTDAGLGTIYVQENWIPKIDRVMAQWTSLLIASAKAYKAPWSVAPTWAPMMVAKLAAPTVATVLRVSSSRYDVKMIADGFAWAEARRSRLENGEPMDDGIGPIDADPTVADIGAAAGNDSNGLPSGAAAWRTGTL